MPAYTKHDPDALVIRFERDGESAENQLVVGSGERVLLHAVGMLIRRGTLQLHDRLSILAAEDEVDIA